MMDDLLQEMIDPEPQRGDVSRWRRLAATVAIFALAGLGVTSLTTSALFTDRESTAGDLLTGTVDVSLGSDGGSSQFISVPTEGMTPGGVLAKAITVTNAGSLQLRYAVSYEAENDGAGTLTSSDTALDGTDAEALAGTGDLRTQLTLDVFPVASTGACTTTTTPANGGTQQDLSVVAADTIGGFSPILGNATTTPFQDGRVLGAGDSEVLCVQIRFASTADNTFQNTTAKVALQIDAEQVVNNPSSSDVNG